jgi:hypothetical protein
MLLGLRDLLITMALFMMSFVVSLARHCRPLEQTASFGAASPCARTPLRKDISWSLTPPRPCLDRDYGGSVAVQVESLQHFQIVAFAIDVETQGRQMKMRTFNAALALQS